MKDRRLGCSAGMKAIMDALHVVSEEKEKMPLIKLNLISLAFTIAATVPVLVSSWPVVVLPVALSFLGFQNLTGLAVSTRSTDERQLEDVSRLSHHHACNVVAQSVCPCASSCATWLDIRLGNADRLGFLGVEVEGQARTLSGSSRGRNNC
jgi:hypothetical protein